MAEVVWQELAEDESAHPYERWRFVADLPGLGDTISMPSPPSPERSREPWQKHFVAMSDDEVEAEWHAVDSGYDAIARQALAEEMRRRKIPMSTGELSAEDLAAMELSPEMNGAIYVKFIAWGLVLVPFFAWMPAYLAGAASLAWLLPLLPLTLVGIYLSAGRAWARAVTFVVTTAGVAGFTWLALRHEASFWLAAFVDGIMAITLLASPNVRAFFRAPSKGEIELGW